MTSPLQTLAAARSIAAPRLYLSGRLYRKLAWGTAVIAIGGLALSVLAAEARWSQSLWFLGVLVGVGIGSLVLLSWARSEDAECAFCREPRAKVGHLVAGPSVSICDACAPLPLSVVMEGHLARGKPDLAYWQLLEAIPRRAPRALSGPLIDELSRIASDRAARQRLLAAAFRVGNEPAAGRLLASVPEAQREPSDWLNLSVALSAEGRDREALAALDHVDLAKDPSLGPWIANNRAWYRARGETAATAAERTEWLNQVRAAAEELRRTHPSGWQHALACCRGTESQLCLLLGRTDEALAALDEAETLEPSSAARMALRAQALEQKGQHKAALAQARAALASANPESSEAMDARKLMDRLGAHDAQSQG